MMEGPRHQHPHQEWQEPLEERLCAMMSQMRLTSSDISANAPTTKTEFELELELIQSHMAQKPMSAAG